MKNDLLASLKACRTHHAYTCLPVSHLPIYVAINDDDRVALIVRAPERSIQSHLSTDLLSLRLSVRSQISVGSDSVEDGFFHILLCESDDMVLMDSFLLLSQALATEISSLDGASIVLTGFFDSLAQLFRMTAAPNLALERQGLWGELLVLGWTGNIPAYAQFWHSEPNRKYDFAHGAYRLEVKTTTSPTRVHSFAHQQLLPIGQKEIVVASLVLRPEDTGRTLRDLIEEARSFLSHDVAATLRLEKAIRKAGMNDPSELGPIFDEDEAVANLAWYWATDIPKFESPEPPGVTNTRYDVDLSTVATVPPAVIRSWLNGWLTLT